MKEVSAGAAARELRHVHGCAMPPFPPALTASRRGYAHFARECARESWHHRRHRAGPTR